MADRTASIPLLGIASAFLKDWMPLIDEYYYCAFDLILLRWISDEKFGQTLLLSSDCCFCYGFRLCICNASWSYTCSLWSTGVPVPCYHISMSDIFPCLIPYSLGFVRLFPGLTLRSTTQSI